jgi:hypothetical protein
VVLQPAQFAPSWLIGFMFSLGLSLGCLALLMSCARRLGRSPARAGALFGLNPLVLVYGLGGAHNDALMMLLVLSGLLAVLAGRERLAGGALAAGIAIKAAALPLEPFLLLGARRRPRAIAATAAGLVALAVLSAILFGLREPGVREQAAAVTHYSLPELVASALGRGHYQRCPGVLICAAPEVVSAATIVLAVVLALLFWRAWRGGDWLTNTGWAGIAFVLGLTVVMPWYLLWVLPFAILSDSRRLQAATAVLGGYMLTTSEPVAYVVALAFHRLSTFLH